MRERILGAVVGFAVLVGMPVWAQMHKVEPPPQQVVRAVGVYEWTGDMAKPKASRLIPVTLFINGQFQDAGVYLARPVPLALATGNVYELRVAGLDRGLLDLEYARHVQDANHDFEDSWYGYGKFTMPAAPRPVIAKGLPPARTSGIVSTVADSDRPTLVRRHESGGTGNGTGSGSANGSGSGSASSQTSSGSAPVSDPDRPVLHRPSDDSASSGGTGGGYGGSDPSADPDRPILQKPADESAGPGAPAAGTQTTAPSSGTSTAPSGTTAASTGASGGSEPGDDPGRPTLKRRTSEEAKQASEEAAVQGTGVDLALNNDPSRPRLHFGVPAGEESSGPARLVGLPADLHQVVAVSDAVDREPHNFARNWADAEERAAILTKMQAFARAKLAAYDAPVVAASTTKKKVTTTAARQSRKKVVAAPTVALMDEVLRGYTLSYGGDPTYVYMAHTAGTGAELRYVTVVAQTDEMGQFKPVIQSVTDAAHLDRTAWMKFVDVVDADATNRASLLFELKSQSMRQFALYRVIAGQAQQIFISGTTE